MNPPESTSTRPYLIRALYEWCTDNGLTPYVAVTVDDSVQVPREFVKNNEIVLNISFDATSSLQLGNDFIQFSARFSGSAREIIVPITHVMAIYARENGQGMSFPTVPLGVHVTDSAPDAFVDKSSMGVLSNATTNKPVESVISNRDEKIVQLVPSGEPLINTTPPDGTNPPKSPTRTRPSLTRVK